MINKFTKGSGCFKCESCGKKTRKVSNEYGSGANIYCQDCLNAMERHNYCQDNNVPCDCKDCKE